MKEIDFAPLYKMIITGDINVIELFSEQPLWTTDDLLHNGETLKVLSWLNEKQGQDAVLHANFGGFVRAGKGMVTSARNKLKQHKMVKASKNLTTAALWQD
ncbi:hypothetical protein [Lactobacillus xujianguonis]|uniref:hypothetical protein n=1 Tax=Lactobacillus xujianguonis TaxID=2495899 RepID=UPI000FD8CBD7|nr:hypothetical protein [Lactobacillus xujianguonis]RVU73334.1 hypothetical protein EJK20_08760 [Lactobacillus xujianguonis]